MYQQRSYAFLAMLAFLIALGWYSLSAWAQVPCRMGCWVASDFCDSYTGAFRTSPALAIDQFPDGLADSNKVPDVNKITEWTDWFDVRCVCVYVACEPPCRGVWIDGREDLTWVHIWETECVDKSVP